MWASLWTRLVTFGVSPFGYLSCGPANIRLGCYPFLKFGFDAVGHGGQFPWEMVMVTVWVTAGFVFVGTSSAHHCILTCVGWVWEDRTWLWGSAFVFVLFVETKHGFPCQWLGCWIRRAWCDRYLFWFHAADRSQQVVNLFCQSLNSAKSEFAKIQQPFVQRLPKQSTSSIPNLSKHDRKQQHGASSFRYHPKTRYWSCQGVEKYVVEKKLRAFAL